MSDLSMSLFKRLALALRTFKRILGDQSFASGVSGLEQAEPASAAPPKPPLRETSPDSALQLLAMLQQEGRFIDFLEENVTAYSDAEIGGAARVVHEGCRKAIRDHLRYEPVRTEDEGAQLTVPAGFDAATVRLTGNVVGEPPFTGSLVHRGWQVTEIHLPKLAEGHNLRVLAPAEVEL